MTTMSFVYDAEWCSLKLSDEESILLICGSFYSRHRSMCLLAVESMVFVVVNGKLSLFSILSRGCVFHMLGSIDILDVSLLYCTALWIRFLI